MESKRKSELYFEEIGEKFDEFMSDYDVTRRLFLLKGMIGEMSFGHGLEVGCGTGKITDSIRGHVDNLTVCDISAKLAEAVAERNGCQWSKEDACTLSFKDNSFDFLVSSECIEHTQSPEKALCEMARVVKPGGFIFVTTPNKFWYPVLWVAEKLGVRKFGGNEIWLFPRQAARILDREGCEVEQISGCHLFPWQLPFAKRILPVFDRWGGLLYPFMINFGLKARVKSR
jgi:ubiquinone/menaquinone biosynthesis C-methylase UbiE